MAVLVLLTGAGADVAYASHGGAHTGTFRTWQTGSSAIFGFDPHETRDDVAGLTVHVGAPAMVSSMENTCGGFCGLMYWNPTTNAFKTYCVTGGFQFALDVNTSTPSGAAKTFGGGDVWATVTFNSSFSPYMNFRGSDDFRRWDVGASEATGIRVNAATGKVYFGNFGSFSTASIIELDPATNTVRKWATGSRPYFLVLDGDFVYATAVAGGGHPDQILRLNTVTNELKRWAVPGGGFQSFIGVGTPNNITRDAEGNIWFTESASDEMGRLNPTTNIIDEFTKAGVDNPHFIASSGAGATLQAFVTEATGQQVSVLTVAAAAPTSTTVTPSTETVTPTVSTVTPVDFVPSQLSTTITPVTTAVTSTDPSGIDRFPIPTGTLNPTGMTRVAFPNTVFGSMEGSDHVFEFVSEAIIAPPPGAVQGRMTGGGSVFTATGTRVTHGFELHCDASKGPNNLQVNWGGNRFHLESLTSASCSDDPSISPAPPTASFDTHRGEGTGRYNGVSGATIKWTFTDAGEPGRNDTATIEIKDGSTVVLSVSGNLKAGNHQAHDE